MQPPHGIAKALAGRVPLDPFDAVGEIPYVRREFIHGPCMLATGDTHFGRGLVCCAMAVGLAALGRVEPAGDGAEVILDTSASVFCVELVAKRSSQRLSNFASPLRTFIGGFCPVLGHGRVERWFLVHEAAKNSP